MAFGFSFLVAAVFFRDVLGIFAVLVLALAVIRKRELWLRITLTAGAVLAFGLALLMVFQWYTTGQPLGFHAGTLLGSDGGLLSHLKERPLLFYLYFCAAHPDRVWSVIFAAPFILAFLIRPRLPKNGTAGPVFWWALVALLSGTFFLYGFFQADNPLRHLLVSNSFFFASPILIFGLL